MATKITPRMERAYAYASNEAFCHSYEGLEPLRRDFQRMIADDIPEADIIMVLLEVPKVILRHERVERVVTAICSALAGQPPQ